MAFRKYLCIKDTRINSSNFDRVPGTQSNWYHGKEKILSESQGLTQIICIKSDNGGKTFDVNGI